MAKRAATTELNHDNWNDEVPSEEAGTFRTASHEVTSQRVLKKAKRRIAENSESGVFKGFSGFAPTKPASTSSPFSNLLPSDGFKSSFEPGTPKLTISPFVVGDQTPKPGDDKGSRAEYLQQLRSLNESVVTWISQQMDKGPLGVLHPIFNEYNQYQRQLAQKHSQRCAAAPKNELALQCQLFGKKNLAQLRRLNAATLDWIKLHVGKNPLCILSPIFDDYGGYVKQLEEDVPQAAPSVFGSGFTFGVAAGSPAGGADKTGTANDDDNYEPPKNEVREVKEDDAFYSVRCKLFYKKEGRYVEKGTGGLFLKTIDGKTQLLVRAETNLGNILLNVFLFAKMPTSRVGKNNVTLVCLPNPPLDAKNAAAASEPVTFLVRVKDAIEADDLLAKLEENKGASS